MHFLLEYYKCEIVFLSLFHITKHMALTFPTIGDVNFDCSLKVMFDKFFHYKIISFPFVIN